MLPLQIQTLENPLGGFQKLFVPDEFFTIVIFCLTQPNLNEAGIRVQLFKKLLLLFNDTLQNERPEFLKSQRSSIHILTAVSLLSTQVDINNGTFVEGILPDWN